MQTVNDDCLSTTVKNTSGVERVFGYLGVRGKRLAAGETFTVRGDLVSKLGNQTSARRFLGLKRSLERGSLQILKTPAVHLYDAVDDRVRVLALEGAELGTVDPCWDSEGSSDFADASA
jgi:hypothetical protein